MRQRFSLFFFFLLASTFVKAQKPIEGRWNLTVDQGYRIAPSWLEVRHSGHKMLTGQFVADGGSARPISKVNVEGNKVYFAIPPQWESEDNDMRFEATLENDKLTGVIITPSGRRWNFSGERAPLLLSNNVPVWGKPITLFNGKNTDGWHASGKNNQWIAESGILRSPASGSNLITDAKFNDFKLHIEFRYPEGSNSGVYLRGRYEIQVCDTRGPEPARDSLGAIYGFIIPNRPAWKNPGEWQTLDVTLVGRIVTVALNGQTIISEQPIPGITGGALDSKEGEPGPIMLQGDHGPIDYRNIIIRPAK
ncbi:MAG: DUF1080 domain-containing protein [Sphingobacteriales bacterium]|jgi:hypothetical protein